MEDGQSLGDSVWNSIWELRLSTKQLYTWGTWEGHSESLAGELPLRTTGAVSVGFCLPDPGLLR